MFVGQGKPAKGSYSLDLCDHRAALGSLGLWNQSLGKYYIETILYGPQFAIVLGPVMYNSLRALGIFQSHYSVGVPAFGDRP